MGLIQEIQESDGVPDPATWTQATASDTFNNRQRTALKIGNFGGAPVTVTVAALHRCSHGFFDDHPIVLPGGSITDSLVFPVNRFGHVPVVTYSDPSAVRLISINREALQS